MAKVNPQQGAPMPERIRFKYLFSEEFRPEYANGAQGSVTPQSEIAISFYLERSPMPYSETHKVTDGEIGDQVERDPKEKPGEVLILRQVTNGVVMNVATAQRVYEMLGRLLEALKPKVE